MQDDSSLGCLALIMNIALYFVTGTISFNMVQPQSFLGVLFFLVVWAVVHYISQYVVAFLLAAVFVVLGRK